MTQGWFPKSCIGLLPLFPNAFFQVSLESAQRRRLKSGKVEALVAKLLWAESNHRSLHSKGEEEGALSQAERDLQSRPAVCTLLDLESIALAISC